MRAWEADTPIAVAPQVVPAAQAIPAEAVGAAAIGVALHPGIPETRGYTSPAPGKAKLRTEEEGLRHLLKLFFCY